MLFQQDDSCFYSVLRNHPLLCYCLLPCLSGHSSGTYIQLILDSSFILWGFKIHIYFLLFYTLFTNMLDFLSTLNLSSNYFPIFNFIDYNFSSPDLCVIQSCYYMIKKSAQNSIILNMGLGYFKRNNKLLCLHKD